MKVLFHHRIATRYGQAVHMEELIDALRGLGHEVVVIGPAQRADEKMGEGSASVSALKDRLPRALYEVLEAAYSVLALVRLVRAVRRHRPDAIYERYALYLLAGPWARRLTRTPLLLEVNSPMYQERDAFAGGIALRPFARWAQESVWRGADVVLPVTGALADIVAEAGVPRDRIVVIPNGINPTRFRAGGDGAALRQRLGLDDRFVIGFTGFVREWHGVDRIVALLPDLVARHDAHLLVVGDGTVRADLERRAADLGVAERLTITGFVERDDVAGHIAAFDVAVQIGVTPYASPLKLFEYLAMGRAVVAPATANIAEVLTDGVDAVLFDPDDDADLARAIERVAADPALRERLGAAASRTVDERRLTWTANAERVVELATRLR
jgi:glycosyltransferase involved in cell wall biosynthesis